MYRNNLGALWYALRINDTEGQKMWVLLKRKLKRYRVLSVGFHEIIAVRKWKRRDSTDTKNDFLLGPQKKEK